MRRFLIVLIGRTGSGKTELTKRAMDRLGLKRPISCTTRSPRTGEIDGVHYRFLTLEAFEQARKNGDFVEIDQPYGPGTAFYGRMHVDLAMTDTHHCICDMTEVGVDILQKSGRFPNALYIRLEPINMPVLDRASDRQEGDAKRAAMPIHVDHVIRNDHGDPDGLRKAADELCSYIDQHIHPEG